MIIEVYQVNRDKDVNRITFSNYKELEELNLTHCLSTDYYSEVWGGWVDCKNLEEVFTMFNINHPSNYRGRSMSVSDVVHIYDDGYYFCDRFGFKKIDFSVK